MVKVTLNIKWLSLLVSILLVIGYGIRTTGIGLLHIKLALKMSSGEQITGKYQLPYRLYEPKGNDMKPLVLVLQSAYGRGDDNFRQLSPTVEQFVSNEFQSLESAFILAPQCPAGLEWNNNPPKSPPFVNYDMDGHTQSWRQDLIIEIINNLIEQKRVDPTRIYITGESMGASGSWEFLYRFPNTFAAAIILNGRSDPLKAKIIGQTPIKIFHGKHDTIAPISNSISMLSSLKVAGADVELVTLNEDHIISNTVYTEQLFKWLLNNHKNTGI